MEEDSGKHKVETSSFGFSKTNNLLNVFNKLKEDIEILKTLVDSEENEDIEELSESVKGLEENVRSLITDKSQKFANGFGEYSGNVGNSFITQTGDSINGEWGFDYKIPYYETVNEVVHEETINDAIALGPIIKSLTRCISYLMNGNPTFFRESHGFYSGNIGLSTINSHNSDEISIEPFSYKIPSYMYKDYIVLENTLSDKWKLNPLLREMCNCIAYLMDKNPKETEDIEKLKNDFETFKNERDSNFKEGFVEYLGNVSTGLMTSPDGNWSFEYPIPSYEYNNIIVNEEQISDRDNLGPIIKKLSECVAYLMEKDNAKKDNEDIIEGNDGNNGYNDFP